MNEQELVAQVVEGAKFALQNDRHPSYSIIVNQYNEIVASSQSLASSEMDPTAHSEILAIREASKKSRTLDLSSLTLYTTIEPCLMCLSACYWAKIKRIVYILGRDKLEKSRYEGDFNNKEVITKFNSYIQLEHNTIFEEKMMAMIDIWEDRNKRYWKYA